MEELVFTSIHQIQDVFDQRILVLVGHTSHIVRDVSGIMLDQEFVASRFKVWVGGQHVGSLDERVVSCRWVGVGSCGGVVESCKDTGGTFSFNQLADDCVVKDCLISTHRTLSIHSWGLTLDRGPLDLLSDVFLLLSFERELDKDLLELLVDVINTELLERVVLEDLESASTSQ